VNEVTCLRFSCPQLHSQMAISFLLPAPRFPNNDCTSKTSPSFPSSGFFIEDTCSLRKTSCVDLSPRQLRSLSSPPGVVFYLVPCCSLGAFLPYQEQMPPQRIPRFHPPFFAKPFTLQFFRPLPSVTFEYDAHPLPRTPSEGRGIHYLRSFPHSRYSNIAAF